MFIFQVLGLWVPLIRYRKILGANRRVHTVKAGQAEFGPQDPYDRETATSCPVTLHAVVRHSHTHMHPSKKRARIRVWWWLSLHRTLSSVEPVFTTRENSIKNNILALEKISDKWCPPTHTPEQKPPWSVVRAKTAWSVVPVRGQPQGCALAPIVSHKTWDSASRLASGGSRDRVAFPPQPHHTQLGPADQAWLPVFAGKCFVFLHF